MGSVTEVDRLAGFAAASSYSDLTSRAEEQLKIRVLDSLGCALGALGSPVVRAVRAQVEELGGGPGAGLIGGGRTAPDRAALYNGALVRYLDFNDSYLAPGETCHPSDNLGAVLAAAEFADADGKDTLTALAVAYQVQCRLSDEAPVRARGFDHTTQGSYAAAAGVSRALGLDAEETANAVAISGTAFNALRVTRTGALSNWKGLAYPNTAFCATHAAFLARAGITGPPEVFEGNKGFKESIAGPFEVDWESEGTDRVNRTIIKRFNAEIHSQSAVEAATEIRAEHGLGSESIESVRVETFDVAYHIIGGGEEGDKTIVRTKEEADHSLPYMVAVALLDGELLPRQYRSERIGADDVQSLLQRVEVVPSDELSGRFPDEMPTRVAVNLKDGRSLSAEKRDYHGFHTRPMDWDAVVEKFRSLSEPVAPAAALDEIESAVRQLDSIKAADLVELLAAVPRPRDG